VKSAISVINWQFAFSEFREVCQAVEANGENANRCSRVSSSRVPAGKSGQPAGWNIAQRILQTVFQFEVANQPM
jgi:hypothetical protein